MEKNCPIKKIWSDGHVLVVLVKQGFEYGAQNSKRGDIWSYFYVFECKKTDLTLVFSKAPWLVLILLYYYLAEVFYSQFDVVKTVSYLVHVWFVWYPSPNLLTN